MEALKMESTMTEWNNDRLDELNERVKAGFIAVDKRFEQVDKRFEQVDKRFVHLEGEMKNGFAKVDQRLEGMATREEIGEIRAELTDRLNHFDARLDRVLNTVLAAALGMAGTAFVAVLGLIASQL